MNWHLALHSYAEQLRHSNIFGSTRSHYPVGRIIIYWYTFSFTHRSFVCVALLQYLGITLYLLDLIYLLPFHYENSKK